MSTEDELSRLEAESAASGGQAVEHVDRIEALREGRRHAGEIFDRSRFFEEIDDLAANFRIALLKKAGSAAAKNGRTTLFISIDRIDRHHGGPEEGGWWYDAGEVVQWEAIRVWGYNEGNDPHLHLKADGLEFLNVLAREILSKVELGTCHRSSASPTDNDYQWRITDAIPENWSNREPYC